MPTEVIKKFFLYAEYTTLARLEKFGTRTRQRGCNQPSKQ